MCHSLSQHKLPFGTNLMCRQHYNIYFTMVQIQLKMGCSKTPLGHYALLVTKSNFDLFE